MTVLRLLLALLFVAAIAGGVFWFSGSPADQSSAVRFSTGSSGGTYYQFANAFAEVSTDLDVAVLQSAGANENARRLADGEADVALIQSDTAVGDDISIIAQVFPEAFHLIVHDDSGIQSVNGLRGKRIGVPPVGSGTYALFQVLLKHYEIEPDEVTLVIGSLRDHARAIKTGDIDAFFMVIALGNSTIEEIVETTDTQLISIDNADAIALFDPALEASTMPVGTYSGERPVPAEPISVVTVRSLIAARGDLPNAVAEEVTKTLYERRQAMVRLLPQAAFLSAPTEQQVLTFGVHPGAARYYAQDDPIFIVEYAEPIALGVTALALLASGLWQARIWLAGTRKNRADHYNLEIVGLTSKVEAATSVCELEELRGELFAIFQKVIVDLDNDRIEERSLLSFSFAWQVASNALNHRQLMLRPHERDEAVAVDAVSEGAVPPPVTS